MWNILKTLIINKGTVMKRNPNIVQTQLFSCWYEITNENWESKKRGELRIFSTSLERAEWEFHDLMSDLMGTVDGADDYFITINE